MRIGMVASNFIRIPPLPEYVPKGFSGAPEYMVSLLTEGLIKRGHEVALFASGDSKTTGKLKSVSPICSSRQPKGNNVEYVIDQEHLLVSLAYKMAKEKKFDLIHSHIGSRTAFYASFVSTPTVVTIHSPLNGEAGSVLSAFPSDQFYVSISDRQRRPLPNLHYAGTVYHGLDLTSIPFSPKGGDFLLFVGRLAPQKGVLEAIRVAKRLNKKLMILGTPPKGSAYFDKKIKPLVDGKQIEVHGFMEKKSLYELMGKAAVLLFPIQWEEPFGLVMIEAMSCGTPVVAFNRGSVSEIVDQGVTGYIVPPKRGVDGLAEAVSKVGKIDRSACRKYAESRFTVEKMVEGYEKVYEKVLKNF